MKLIELPDGSKAWVCDTVGWAIYPEPLVANTSGLTPALTANSLYQN
jgi:hypothetical protein